MCIKRRGYIKNRECLKNLWLQKNLNSLEKCQTIFTKVKVKRAAVKFTTFSWRDLWHKEIASDASQSSISKLHVFINTNSELVSVKYNNAG